MLRISEVMGRSAQVYVAKNHDELFEKSRKLYGERIAYIHKVLGRVIDEVHKEREILGYVLPRVHGSSLDMVDYATDFPLLFTGRPEEQPPHSVSVSLSDYPYAVLYAVARKLRDPARVGPGTIDRILEEVPETGKCQGLRDELRPSLQRYN